MGPIVPPISPAAGISFTVLLAELYPKLNAAAAADLVYWTDAELYEWADEAAKRLARTRGVFVERVASSTVIAGSESYGVPQRHVSTIHVAIAGVGLDASNVQEIEALDGDWPNTEGPSQHWLFVAGTDFLRLYPIPDATTVGALSHVFHRFPSAISSGNPTVAAPMCLEEYFSWRMLSEARKKESDASMPEVADHFAARVDLMEKVIEAYWGDSQ